MMDSYPFFSRGPMTSLRSILYSQSAACRATVSEQHKAKDAAYSALRTVNLVQRVAVAILVRLLVCPLSERLWYGF